MSSLLLAPTPAHFGDTTSFDASRLHYIEADEMGTRVRWSARAKVANGRILVQRWVDGSTTIQGHTHRFCRLDCTAIAKLTKAGTLGSFTRWENEKYLIRATFAAWEAAGKPDDFTHYE